MKSSVDPQALRREDLAEQEGAVLLEFGAAWCGVCQSYRSKVAALLKKFPEVQHIRIEDGSGKPLGRSFRVKLWPTFVFLRNGNVLQQSVRPEMREIEKGLEAISADDNAKD